MAGCVCGGCRRIGVSTSAQANIAEYSACVRLRFSEWLHLKMARGIVVPALPLLPHRCLCFSQRDQGFVSTSAQLIFPTRAPRRKNDRRGGGFGEDVLWQSLIERCHDISFCHCRQGSVEWFEQSSLIFSRWTRGQIRCCDASTVPAVTHSHRLREETALPKPWRGSRWVMGRSLNAEGPGNLPSHRSPR